MNDLSKPIKKADDASKQFIIDCLKGDMTHGFDIDSIYYFQGQWYLFEYLKCESDRVSPHTSDPKYYPYNWKKFYSLYTIAKKLDGKLFLVNYSTREKDCNKVKLMEVLDFDYEKAIAYERDKKRGPNEYMSMKSSMLSLEQYSKWLREINRGSLLPNYLDGEVKVEKE